MLVPKFEIGQKVCAVFHQYDSRKVPEKCDLCGSTGKVKIENKEGEYTCPHCYGRTRIEYTGFKFSIDCRNATIGKIQTEEYGSEYDCKSGVSYMLKETGVGSGRVWREDRLFANEGEAQYFCDHYIPADPYDSKTPVLKELYNGKI